MPESNNKKNRKTKVLHVITRLDSGGSADNTLHNLLRVDTSRFESSLVYGLTKNPSPLLDKAKRRRDITLYHLPILVREISPVKDIKAFLAIKKIIKTVNFDIVHTHTSKAGFLGRLAGRLTKQRCVIHTPHGHIFYGYYGGMKSMFFILLERVAARWCDTIITLTEKGKRDHLEAKIGTPEKIKTIHSGVEISKFRRTETARNKARRRWNVPEDAVIIGAVGRLTEIKGQSYLIEAFARLSTKNPLLHLVLVGDGELKAELKRLASDYNLANKIIFPGQAADPSPAYSGFDIFALPSLNEGMGKVLVEAMAAGLPIVASEVGGVPEIIEEGKNGYLVPPAKPESLAEVIERLLDSPAEMRAMKKQNERTATCWSLDLMIKRIEQLYHNFLET